MGIVNSTSQPTMTAQDAEICQLLAEAAQPYKLRWELSPNDDACSPSLPSRFLVRGTDSNGAALDPSELSAALAYAFEAARQAFAFKEADKPPPLSTTSKGDCLVDGDTIDALASLKILSTNNATGACTVFGEAFKHAMLAPDVTNKILTQLSDDTQKFPNGGLSFKYEPAFDNTLGKHTEHLGPGYLIRQLNGAEDKTGGAESAMNATGVLDNLAAVRIRRSMSNVLRNTELNLGVDLKSGMKFTEKGLWVSEDIIKQMVRADPAMLRAAFADAFAPPKEKGR